MYLFHNVKEWGLLVSVTLWIEDHNFWHICNSCPVLLLLCLEVHFFPKMSRFLSLKLRSKFLSDSIEGGEAPTAVGNDQKSPNVSFQDFLTGSIFYELQLFWMGSYFITKILVWLQSKTSKLTNKLHIEEKGGLRQLLYEKDCSHFITSIYYPFWLWPKNPSIKRVSKN